jgi:hypothetical protein
MSNKRKVTLESFQSNLETTIKLLKKGEKIKPMDQNLSARLNDYEKLKKENFSQVLNWYETNISLIDNLKKAYETWDTKFTDGEKKAIEYKNIGFYVEKLSEKPKEETKKIQQPDNKPIPEPKDSSNADNMKKPDVASVGDGNISVKKEENTKEMNRQEEKVRHQNPHRQKVSDSQNHEKLLQRIDALEKRVITIMGTTERELTRNIEAILKHQELTRPSFDMEKKLRDMSKDIALDVAKFSKGQSNIDTIVEAVEVIPNKMDKITEKLDLLSDDIESGVASGINRLKEVPKDEKAVLMLTEYMHDGLKELENIARHYIQKQSVIEKESEKLISVEEERIKAKNEGYAEGYKKGQTELVKKLYARFPDTLEKIKSMFEDDGLIATKYSEGETLTVTDDNRQQLEIEIEGVGNEEEITIESVALILDGEVLKRATVKERQSEE